MMEATMHATGKYLNQRVELDQPLPLQNGTPVEVEVIVVPNTVKEDWTELGMSRLEEEWDNPQDAIYDDWRRLYGVPKR